MPSPNSALALIPRSLKLSPSTVITRTHLLALYKEELRVAHSFSSYNFRNYFIRRTRDKFRGELPSLLDTAFAQGGAVASTSSLPHIAISSSSSPKPSASSEAESSIYAPTSSNKEEASVAGEGTTPEDRLREWYRESLTELGVMARSAVVNRMYEAPKLVVEGRGRVMVSGGGGAGAEAGSGGGGQPEDGQKNIPASPAL